MAAIVAQKSKVEDALKETFPCLCASPLQESVPALADWIVDGGYDSIEEVIQAGFTFQELRHEGWPVKVAKQLAGEPLCSESVLCVPGSFECFVVSCQQRSCWAAPLGMALFLGASPLSGRCVRLIVVVD